MEDAVSAFFEHLPEAITAAAASDRAMAAAIVLILGGVVAIIAWRSGKRGAISITALVLFIGTAVFLYGWQIVIETDKLKEEERVSILRAATEIRDHITRGQLRDAQLSLESLSRKASESGHALYFSGELHRIGTPVWPRNRYQARDWFVRYLDNDPKVKEAAASDRLEAAYCYERVDGYCPQRVGWVAHLLANFYYEWSADASVSAADRGVYLQQAKRFVETSQRIGRRPFAATAAPPGKVVDNRYSTDELTRRIEVALKTE